jgi:hypothetical protein
MIYKEPGCLAVAKFGPPPLLLTSKWPLFLSLPVCRLAIAGRA